MNRLLLLFVFLPVSMIVYSQPQPIKILQHNKDDTRSSIKGLNFSEDGEEIVSVIGDTRIWNINTYELDRLYPFGGSIAEFSKKGTYLIVNGFPLTRVVNLVNGELIAGFNGHPFVLGEGRNQYPLSITGYAISNNNKLLISHANDKTGILWNIESQELIHQFTYNKPGTLEKTGFEWAQSTFAPDGSLVAFGHSFFNTSTFEKEFEFSEPNITNNNLISVGFSPTNRFFYSVGGDGYIRMWDWETKDLSFKMKIHLGGSGVVYTPDEKYLISIGSGNIIKIIDLNQQSIISEFEHNEPGSSENVISIHPNGQLFAIGVGEGEILIYDLQEVLASQSGVADWEGYE